MRAPRSFVIQPEQRDDGGDIGGAAGVVADPSRLRVDVMGFGPASRNQLIFHADRKRQIGEAIAVQVAELAPAHTELDPAESMRSDGHAVPAGDGLFNLACDRPGHDSLDDNESRMTTPPPPPRPPDRVGLCASCRWAE